VKVQGAREKQKIPSWEGLGVGLKRVEEVKKLKGEYVGSQFIREIIVIKTRHSNFSDSEASSS